MEILMIQQGHPLWDKVIPFAQNCSWAAGPIVAERMRTNAFRDRERVIIAADGGEIAGYCMFSERDELPEEYTFTPFISAVFVGERYRGNRLSQRMIEEGIHYAKGLGYHRIYIMSGEHGLYEKYGFTKQGEYETVYGTVDQLFQRDI